jgi:hypothetical protein
VRSRLVDGQPPYNIVELGVLSFLEILLFLTSDLVSVLRLEVVNNNINVPIQLLLLLQIALWLLGGDCFLFLCWRRS